MEHRVSFVVAPELPRRIFRSFSFLRPHPQILKNWKHENSPRDRSARDWAGAARFARAGGWDAVGETARETENMATWGCESGRDRVRGGADRGSGGGVAEFQIFRISALQAASDSRRRPFLRAPLCGLPRAWLYE